MLVGDGGRVLSRSTRRAQTPRVPFGALVVKVVRPS